MKTIIISGINIYQGGAMTVLKSCLNFLEENLTSKYKIIALVHDVSMFKYEKIELIEFPLSRKSWLARIYYEYFYFKSFSQKIKPYVWFSMHDITPNVIADIRVVYCHNSSPFYQLKIEDFLLDKGFSMFVLFYKYLYALNIKSNAFVITQQSWLREEFRNTFRIEKDKIIVAHFNNSSQSNKNYSPDYEIPNKHPEKTFFYPAFPRVFKNIELICEATKYLHEQGIKNFIVKLTIDGTENEYSKKIVQKYPGIPSLDFIGIQSSVKVQEIYELADCLIFSSKLESWGLPITEFKELGKPILCADLPYAHETVGEYDLVSFFDPESYIDLATMMAGIVTEGINFSGSKHKEIPYPHTKNWEEVFDIILSN